MRGGAVMSQKKFLKTIIELLSGAKIAYMISGSIGSGFYGRPRATNDADIIVDLTREQLLAFIQSLGDRYYASREAAMQALDCRSMFNVIDVEYGWKADLIIRKTRPFSQTEFARRKEVSFWGMKVWVLSPEDCILSKLEWSGGDSQIQYEDALGVLMVGWNTLDFDYLKTWAEELKAADLLERLIEEAKKLKRLA